jgi:cardiolipin synthase
LLCVTSGCQSIPFAGVLPDGSCGKCCHVLARQIVIDSCRELAHRPLLGTSELLCEEGGRIGAGIRGEIGKRVCMRRQIVPQEMTSDGWMLDRAALNRECGAPTDNRLEAAQIQLYTDGTQALLALEQIIADAVHQIDVLMFVWEDDEVGRTIARWLAAKASPDLRVRVLVDGSGNLIFGRAGQASAGTVNQTVLALAQHPYVELVRVRNPFARLDHRKLVVADGHVAWTGGRNFADRFFQQHDISFTLQGPLVTQLQRTYDRYWSEQGAETVPHGLPLLACHVRSETTQIPEGLNAWASLVVTEPLHHELAKVLYQAVDRAQHYILIENVYLTDSLLLYKLAQARRRGVDVRVVLTLESRERIINCANRVTANRLLKAGVRVYLYPGMTHVKAAIVDGDWAYLGTGNFDALSLRRNCEFGLAIGGGPIIQELEHRLFLSDMPLEWELKKTLPVSLKDRLYEWVAGLWL